jgi:Flp pilus assembly protein TadD
MRSRHDEAQTVLTQLVGDNPSHARAQNLRGVICATRGDQGCAMAAFEASLKADSRDANVYVNLGHLYLERGDRDTAARYFSEAIAIDPSAEAARDALRTVWRN